MVKFGVQPVTYYTLLCWIVELMGKQLFVLFLPLYVWYVCTYVHEDYFDLPV